MTVVVATMKPLPDARAGVHDALLTAVPKVHAEDGVRAVRVAEGTDRYVLIEKWSSQAALDVHAAAPALAELRAALGGSDRPPDIQVLSGVPGGTAEQGAF
jgi:quinol monooxygenase YgiN